MPAINRIRVIEKSDVLCSYCVTVYLPHLYPNNTYNKQRTSDVPSSREPGDRARYEAFRPVSKTINAILAVPGVTVLRIFDYELQVTIAAAYSWPECDQAVLAAIQEHLFGSETTVEVVRFGKPD